MDDIEEYDTYMPDRLNSNAKGYELWSHCIEGIGSCHGSSD